MRLFATLLLLAAMLLAPASRPRAYTLQLNSTATVQIRWPTTNITVALSSSLTSPPSNIKAGSDVVGAARRALRRWEEASNIRFTVTSSSAEAVTTDCNNNPAPVNLITVSPVNASLFTNPEQTGRARICFDPNSGAITDGDVAVNPGSPFSTDGTANTFDLESTFVHEIGHMLGLEHSGLAAATMQPRQVRNGTFDLPAFITRTLSTDDVAGIRAIYGPRAGLGAIAGTVSTPAGALFGAHVVAEEVSTGRAWAGNVTLPGGAYRIDSLPAGQYRVIVEPLNEPVAAGEIPTRSGAYAGLVTGAPSFRTFEAGAVTVAEDATTPFNVTLPDNLSPFVNPRYVGINGQLTTAAAPVVPGTSFSLLVGGDNVHTVPATGISITSPYFTVDQSSVQQLVFSGPSGNVQVLSFRVTVGVTVPPGEYDIRLAASSGEVAYVTAGLTVDLPNGMTSASPNLIDNPQFFVAQHYRDFLNREPDAAGLAFWTDQMTHCGNPNLEVCRINVSAAFFLSIEFKETGYLVYRFYKAAFGSFTDIPVPVRFADFLPDTQRISRGVIVNQGDWQTKLEQNKQAFAVEFVSRPAFTSRYPTSLTPAQFVDQLFANAGVTPTDAERQAAINEFNGAGNTADTAARARALRRVAENPTLVQQEFNRAFVLMEYFGYLRRDPDATGYNFWLSKLNQFGGNFVQAEMVKAFLNSLEYRQRFGPQ